MKKKHVPVLISGSQAYPAEESRFGGLFLKTWHPYFWIVLAVFALYFRALFFEFSYLDDYALILNKLHFLSDISNVFQAFREGAFYSNSDAYYRPIVTVSFMLDAWIGGASPVIYHFTNILLHSVASCLVFALLARLGHRKETSLFVSLVFAAHPLMTNVVACIVQRNDSLLAVFVLAGFISLVNYFEQNKWRHAVWHHLFFALALFDRENAIFLPVIAVIYIGLIKREKIFSAKMILPAAGWLMVFGMWFFLRDAALTSRTPLVFTGVFKSMLTGGISGACIFIGKLLLPVNITVLATFRDSPKIYGVVATVIIALCLCASSQRRLNFIFFGLAWFLVFLLPTFLLASTTAVVNIYDNRVYLPVAGLFILIAETDMIKNLDFRKKGVFATVALILLGLSLISFMHSVSYRNRMSFWKAAAKDSPHSPLAHRNLGAMYYLDGLPDKAEIAYRIALSLNPYEPMVHNNLGLIYANKNMLKEAEIEYRKEIEINPAYDTVYFNFGLLYFRQGKFKEAEEMWKKTLEINPDYIDAYKNLAVYYYRQKDRQQAMHCINQLKKRGVKADPKLLKALENDR